MIKEQFQSAGIYSSAVQCNKSIASTAIWEASVLSVCFPCMLMQLMGIREDPYAFFIDMFKLALMMQLLSAAVVFYGAELGLGLDAGDALRAVAGLTLGYFLRLSIKIEHLVRMVGS